MSDKLKPCPFCGEEARLVPSKADGYCQVECVKLCVQSIPRVNKHYAIEAWNKRVSDTKAICGVCGAKLTCSEPHCASHIDDTFDVVTANINKEKAVCDRVRKWANKKAEKQYPKQPIKVLVLDELLSLLDEIEKDA